VDPSYFLIPDGLKFRGQHTLLKLWEKALTPPALHPLQENDVSEVGHNRDYSSHSPFLHTAPIQGARAPDADFLIRLCAVTPSFKSKIECIPLCVPGSIFTHKATNSEINYIASV
jgi:hypothetical protein